MNLKELNLRLKGVKSTRKITKAMKMVSYAKLKKIQFFLIIRNNHVSFLNILEKKKVSIDYKKNFLKIITKSYRSKKMIFLVSSDKGLCGSLNLFNLKLTKYLLTLSKNYYLYLVGKKGVNSLIKTHSLNILNSSTNLSFRSFGEKGILFIANNLCKYFLFLNLKNGLILGNKYKSTSKHYCVYSFFFIKNKMIFFNKYFNKDRKNLTVDLYYFINYNLIYSLFLDNQTSEESSRTNAMENATQNASNRIDLLEMELKLVRQAMITSELLEIISGADALSK